MSTDDSDRAAGEALYSVESRASACLPCPYPGALCGSQAGSELRGNGRGCTVQPLFPTAAQVGRKICSKGVVRYNPLPCRKVSVLRLAMRLEERLQGRHKVGETRGVDDTGLDGHLDVALGVQCHGSGGLAGELHLEGLSD